MRTKTKVAKTRKQKPRVKAFVETLVPNYMGVVEYQHRPCDPSRAESEWIDDNYRWIAPDFRHWDSMNCLYFAMVVWARLTRVEKVEFADWVETTWREYVGTSLRYEVDLHHRESDITYKRHHRTDRNPDA